jgi:threonine dehydrogenase-like Zn-dependent dehydrogenase
MGLLTLVLAKLAGASQVVVSDLLANKRAIARQLGADAVLDAKDLDLVENAVEISGGGADVVFDCVGSVTTMNQGWRAAAKGATVIVIGLSSGSLAAPMPLVQDKELKIQGSMMFVDEDFEAALSLVAKGRIPTEDLVTVTFPLEQAPEAFRLAGEGRHVKVHVIPE